MVVIQGDQGTKTMRPRWLPGDSKPSSARHPKVAMRQVALTEALRAQQILKGFFVEVAGEKFAVPIDSWEDRTRFLGEDMWSAGVMPKANVHGGSQQAAVGLMGSVVEKLTACSVADARGIVEQALRETEEREPAAAADGLPFRVGAVASPGNTTWQARALAWLRDTVDNSVPAVYYRESLGHDLHVSTWGDLYGKQFHVGWASPFDSGAGESVRGAMDPTFETTVKTHWPAPSKRAGERLRSWMRGGHTRQCRLGGACPARSYENADALIEDWGSRRGFVENLGWLSGAKVTSAFVSEEIDELVSTTGTEYADFDFHEVGTSNTAESNAHTALQTTSGIARATGTPTDADPIYRSVATITADTSETWQEHGIFNNTTSVAMMDRNLTGGQAVVSSDQVQYTFELTKNPEA